MIWRVWATGDTDTLPSNTSAHIQTKVEWDLVVTLRSSYTDFQLSKHRSALISTIATPLPGNQVIQVNSYSRFGNYYVIQLLHTWMKIKETALKLSHFCNFTQRSWIRLWTLRHFLSVSVVLSDSSDQIMFERGFYVCC